MQIKKREDGKTGRRFMATICFYQDSRHEEPLLWIQKILRAGYVSRRNDHMTELRVNGFKQVEAILKILLPHIRFKKIQAEMLYAAVQLLQKKTLTERDYRKLVEYIVCIQKENYASRKKKSESELLGILGLTP